jgi:hypothetical protein
MLFEEKHFGKPISDKLSYILVNYTNEIDRLEAVRGTNITREALGLLIRRGKPVTKENSTILISLSRVAFHNVERERVRTEEIKDFLIEELEMTTKDNNVKKGIL